VSRALEFDGVSVDLGGRAVLRDVELTLTDERIAVIGANGSGKSTLARLLNGLVAPSRGSVRVHGLDVARETRAVRRRVGFVFTDPAAQILMPTVAEDVGFSLRGRGLARDEIAARTAEVLARYGLQDHASAPAHSLSGGQKQLLALASVLVTEPALVVADEPTTLLDLGNARRIGALLTTELDAQLVVVTHDLDLALRCDAAVLVADGRIADVGPPARLVADYRAAFA
jgi:biotin transport system ATP-binding protein